MIIKASRIFRCLERFPAPKNCYFCASDEKEASIRYLHDRALLASNVIKMITSKNQLEEFKAFQSDSLHESIIKYLESEKGVEQKARQKLLSYFVDGVQLDHAIWSQMRFQRASVPHSPAIKFYPTYSVTSEIFKRFLNRQFEYYRKPTMITGNFGISKSFSVALFAQLSNMIVEYNFKNYPNKDYRGKSPKIINAPKVIYYNYDQEEVLDNKYLRINIIKQTSPQMSQDKRSNFLNIHPFKKQIKIAYQNIPIFEAYYQKQITAIIIIDQISQYFSLLRRMKYKQYPDIRQGKRISIAFQKMVRVFRRSFNRQLFYLSSMDIQQDLIRGSVLKDQQTQIEIDVIEYANRINQKEYIQQIIQIFLSLLNQKFNVSLLNEKNFKSEVKQMLQEYLTSIKHQYFTNFLFIRQKIDLKNLQFKDETLTRQNIKQKIILLFKQVLQYSEIQLKLRFQSFIQKRCNKQQYSNNMKEIIFQLYMAAQMAIRNQINIFDYEFILNQGKIKEIQKMIVVQQTNIQTDMQKSNMFNNLIYKQFFKLDERKNTLKSRIPPIVIKKALENKFVQALNYVAQNSANLLRKYIKKAGEGQCIEIIMIEIIKQCSFLKFQNNKKQLDTISNSVIINNLKHLVFGFEEIKKDQIDQSTGLKKQKNWNFLKSFIPDLQNAIQTIGQQQKQCSFLFLPEKFKVGSIQIYKERLRTAIKLCQNQNDKQKLEVYLRKIEGKNGTNHLNQQSLNSKAIDFAFVTFDMIHKVIRINAFDSTISRGQQAIRIAKFLDQFMRFSDKQETQLTIYDRKNDQKKIFGVDLGYYVICPASNSSDTIQSSLKKKFQTTLKFEPETIMIRNKQQLKNPNLLKVLSTYSKKNYYLKRVGCFDLFKSLLFDQKQSFQVKQKAIFEIMKNSLQDELVEIENKKEKQELHRLMQTILGQN